MKVAIITGGNRGIGKSVALNAAKRGIGVILTYHTNSAEGASVAQEITKSGGKAVALKLDVSNTSEFPNFVNDITRALEATWARKDFDYLVNNAGTAHRGLIKDTTEKDFDDLFKVHVKGPFFLTQKLLPLMAEGGQIINISSGLTRFSHAGVAGYAMMKGAIEIFTKYLAKEYGEKKIRANVVAPGALDTQFGGGRTDEVRKMVGSQTALGRIGDAEDAGLFIASLLSEDSRWVNAQRIEVSGGMYI